MLPLVGNVEVTIAHIAQVVIHGDRYLDLLVDHESGRDAVRVALHSFARHPEVGDRVRLKVLLGQVDSVETIS